MGKKKKILKAIEGLDKAIEEHKRKIEEYDGKKDYLVPYWEDEIEGFELGKKKKMEKLKK